MKKIESQENRTLLIALAVVCLVVVVIYILYDLERRRQEELRQTAAESLDLETSALETLSTGNLNVLLYFYKPNFVFENHDLFSSDEMLVAETRSIFETEDLTLTARQIVHEVLKGPEDPSLQLFSQHARLRQVYLLEDGTALVDLSQEVVQPQIAGVTVEMAAIYSIARSLTINIDKIQRVKFLVEGRERPTLAGHVSLHDPFM